MARQIVESGQGAFTWTGPYGGGKSSLAIAFSALLNGDEAVRRHAASILGKDTASIVWEALPPARFGWHILPVVGRRDSPARVIGEAIETTSFADDAVSDTWDEQKVLSHLQGIAAKCPRTSWWPDRVH